MASWARTRLLALAGFLLLSLLPWQVQAGTQDAPEFTDDEGDPAIQGTVPIGQVAALSDGIVVVAGWVEANGTDLVFALQVLGDVTLLEDATTYDFEFNFKVNGTDQVASATWTGDFAPGGVATCVA